MTKRSKRRSKRTSKRRSKRTSNKRSKRTSKRTNESIKSGSYKKHYVNTPPYDANECKWRYMKGNDKRNWQSVPMKKSVIYPGTKSDFKWVARQRK